MGKTVLELVEVVDSIVELRRDLGEQLDDLQRHQRMIAAQNERITQLCNERDEILNIVEAQGDEIGELVGAVEGLESDHQRMKARIVALERGEVSDIYDAVSNPRGSHLAGMLPE